jgi:hypothetical protein
MPKIGGSFPEVLSLESAPPARRFPTIAEERSCRGVVWLVGEKRFATADLFAYLIAQVVEGVAVRTCCT